MSATSSAIRFSAAFRTDFQHEFDAFAPDADFRLEEENPGGGSSDPDPDPGSGYGYSGDTSPPSPPDEPYIDTRESIEAYSLGYFEAQGTRHGGNNGASTLSTYLRRIAKGEQNAQYYKVFKGAIGRDIDRWYTYAFKISDIESMDFWGWVERDTSYSTDAAFAHYEKATRIYWEAYRKEWKIRFPQWDTREPLPPLIPPNDGTGGGNDGLPSYLTRLRALLVAFASELDAELQAELLEQLDALMTAGAWVDAGENYHLMGTFSSLYAVTESIWFEEDLPEAVQNLKWKLERTAGNIQAFFYPDKVLAALSMVPAIKELLQHNNSAYAVVEEITALAETYAQLNPQDQAPEPRTPLHCWMYMFWQAQTAIEMRQALEALEIWLQPVGIPLEILGFIHDLSRVVPQALDVRGRDARLLKELIGLGKAYGTLDPLCAENLRGGSFLDTLWSVAQMRRYRPTNTALETSGRALGTQQLKESMTGRRAAPQIPQGSPIRVMQLTRRVLEALKLSTLPMEMKQSRKVLHDFVELSWTYGSLTPTRLTVTEHRREGFFLDTLWRTLGEETIPQAAVQIVEFVAESTNPARLFEFSRRLIKVAKHTPAVSRKKKMASFLKALVYLGREYGFLEPTAARNNDEIPGNLFLNTIWLAQQQTEIKQGVKELEEFIVKIENQTKFLQFERNLLRAATYTNGLEGTIKEVFFLSELLGLGQAYVALNPSPKNPGKDPKFSLNTLWQMRTNLNESEKLRVIIKSSSELGSLIVDSIEPEKRAKLLRMERNLLEIFRDSTELKIHSKDTEFLRELTDLAKAHSILIPPKNLSSINSSKFFLDILWTEGENGKRSGNDRLRETLSRIWGDSINAETFQKSFEFATRLFVASKGGSAAFSGLPNRANYDPYGVLFEPLARLAYAYASLMPTKSDPTTSTFFLHTLWSIDNNSIDADFLAGVDRGNQQLQEFIGFFDSDDQPKIVTFLANVLIAVKMVPSLRQRLSEPSWIYEITYLAIWYLLFDSAFDTEETNALYLLFANVWEMQDEQDIESVVTGFQENVDVISASILPTESLIVSLVLGTVTIAPLVLPPQPPVPLPPRTSLSPGLVAIIAVIVFLKTLDAGGTAQPWEDMVNPITDQPYQSEEEYNLVRALTPEQAEFLKEITPEQVADINRLPRNLGFLANDMLELDPDATRTDDNQRRCVVGEVPRTSEVSKKGKILQHVVRHNAYAQYVTSADTDYFILDPNGGGITYDGRQPETRTVFEVKAPAVDQAGDWRYQAKSNPDSYWGEVAEKSLIQLTDQREKQQRIATICRFGYRYVVASSGMADILEERWAGSIEVEYIPYPYTPFP